LPELPCIVYLRYVKAEPFKTQLGNSGIEAGATEPVEARFKSLAKKWKRDTRFTSSLRQKVNHPAYQEIIGLGDHVIPFILRDLDDHPADWLPALSEITGEDPAKEGATFEQAVHAWLQWGRKLKFL
jgi:hypothetical protein